MQPTKAQVIDYLQELVTQLQRMADDHEMAEVAACFSAALQALKVEADDI